MQRSLIIGALVNNATMSRYVHSFSLMVSAGLPLNKAIGLCAEIIDNGYLEVKIKSDIERGILFIDPICVVKCFIPWFYK